jgi:HEAT repeat protein
MRKAIWIVAGSGMLLLAACGGDPVESQLTALRTGDAAGRKAAAQALADRPDPRAASDLVHALRDPDAQVRCAAARALSKQDAAVALPALVEILSTRAPGHECTYGPLAALHDPRAIPPLLIAASAGDNAPAVDAVVAMGPAAVGPLVNTLRTERDPARARTWARALVGAGGKDALAPLLQLIVENDRTANANAALALGMLGDAQALPALAKAADAGIGPAPEALARLGQPGVDDLLARLDRPSELQRRNAATALAQADRPDVVLALDAALRADSPVHAAGAAQALVRMATTPDHPLHAEAVAALDRAWDRSDTRTIATGVAYYLTRHPDGEDRLIDALEMHGDDVLADAFIASSSDALRAAATEWKRLGGAKRIACDDDGCVDNAPVDDAPAADAPAE